MPFWPGGMEDPGSGIPEELEDELVAEGKGIRTIPPGFTRGLQLPGEGGDDEAGLVALGSNQKHLDVGQEDVVSIPTRGRATYLTGPTQPSSSRLGHEGPSLIGSSEIDDLLPTSVSGGDSFQSMHRRIFPSSAPNSHLSARLTTL